MRLNGLQQQVVHQQNVFAQAPAQVPVSKAPPSISSGLSSFGDRPPTSPQPNFPRNTLEQPPGLQQSPQRLISEVQQGQGTAQSTQGETSSRDDRDVFTREWEVASSVAQVWAWKLEDPPGGDFGFCELCSVSEELGTGLSLCTCGSYK